jgi:ABC-2 type transport system permease protein
MQVFKVYFKVMRGSAVPLVINLGIFLGIAILFSAVAPKVSVANFEATKTPIAVVNRDGNTELVQSFINYLGRSYRLVSYPDNEESLQDALFYRDVEYIAIIPPGFSDAFISDKDPVIKKITVPDSVSSHYVDMHIDKFFNTVRIHSLYGKAESKTKMIAAAIADLDIDTQVTMRTSGKPDSLNEPYSHYYAYCAYALLAMIITGISSVMITFNELNLHMRNLCAPLSKRNIGLQLAIGHSIFALGCWGILMLGSFILYSRDLFPSGLIPLYAFNTLTFAVVSAGIGFLIGGFVRNSSAQAGAINVIALGMSFLGGVFVPQQVMGEPVLSVAKFLPSYWFIKANNAISGLSAFTPDILGSIYHMILIQAAFAGVIFVITLLLSDRKTGLLSHCR